MQPRQKLPILLLVSEERNTGKTTFLNFLKSIFEDNATFNTNEDFRSKFNSDWLNPEWTSPALSTMPTTSRKNRRMSSAPTACFWLTNRMA